MQFSTLPEDDVCAHVCVGTAVAWQIAVGIVMQLICSVVAVCCHSPDVSRMQQLWLCEPGR